MTADIKSAPSALSSATAGLQRAEKAVTKAVNEINATMVAEQNKLAAATGRGEATKLAPNATAQDKVPVPVVAEGDLAKPIVDLLAAKQAYQASAVAVKVTGDIEQSTINMMGKREV